MRSEAHRAVSLSMASGEQAEGSAQYVGRRVLHTHVCRSPNAAASPAPPTAAPAEPNHPARLPGAQARSDPPTACG